MALEKLYFQMAKFKKDNLKKINLMDKEKFHFKMVKYLKENLKILNSMEKVKQYVLME
jgi:hypothetical protein